MNIQILATGSTGNAYLASNGETTLLLECGIPWKKLQKASGFRMSSVDGCLISHEHGDHAKGARDVIKNGIDIYTSSGTASALGIADSHRCKIIRTNGTYRIGTFKVMALPVEHDAAEPFAYLIRDEDAGEMLLFATDLQYLPYNVRGLTHAMIEANYEYESMCLDDSDLNRRIMRSHMSIDALEEWLRTGDAKNTLEQIWLLHLSDARSDEAAFKERIQRATGAEVYVA